MIGAGAYMSVKDAANELGLTICEANELLVRNEIESRTLVLRASVTDYIDGRA